VAAEVLGGVLPFPVRVVGRCANDLRAVARCSFVMAVGILDADKDRACRRVALVPLDRDHGSVTEDELRTVIADAEAAR